MIQRVQTVYLLLAVIFSVVALCLPVGTIEATGRTALGGSQVVATVYNLWVVGDGACRFVTCPLFVLLVCAAVLAGYAIFGYRNRLSQARLCLFVSFLLLGWHVVYAVYSRVLAVASDGQTFSVTWAAVLPFVSLVLCVMARRAIVADEKLVRAADRIR